MLRPQRGTTQEIRKSNHLGENLPASKVRIKAALIYRRPKDLRAVQLLLGHTKLEGTFRYLGGKMDDALEMAEQTVVGGSRSEATPRVSSLSGQERTGRHPNKRPVLTHSTGAHSYTRAQELSGSRALREAETSIAEFESGTSVKRGLAENSG
jgi:hypothetical protein